MKKFENPEIQIEEIKIEDVITTSSSNNCGFDMGVG